MTKKKPNYYYDLKNDLSAYPDAWCYIIVGGRNTGKTYSALRYCVENGIRCVYVKRTIKDVEMISAGHRIGSKTDEDAPDIDLSPFKALNRDFGWNIKAFGVPKVDGVAGFWVCDSDNEPKGAPISYIAALNAVSSIKGFDLSDCDIMLFDEFIPQPWERVSRSEGVQIMELYKTIARDREHRGKAPLKLIALANAVNISNPLMNILEVTDTFANLQARKESTIYIEERGIFLHQIKDNLDFLELEKQTTLYKAMGLTNWGQMAFENSFAYNDFSNVEKRNLKQYRPTLSIIYKRDRWYMYRRDGHVYFCKNKQKCDRVYDLNKDNDIKRFYWDVLVDLEDDLINDRVRFETYTMYDVIVNYKQFFKF